MTNVEKPCAWEAEFGRPKVGGRGGRPLIGWDSLTDLSEPIRGLPLSASHLKSTNFLIFDSNSTSDRSLSNVLKIYKTAITNSQDTFLVMLYSL